MAETIFMPHDGYHLSAENRKDRCSQIRPVCNKKHFDLYKKNAGFLFFAADNLLEKMAGQLPDKSIGFMLFSKESCLLKLYGSKLFLQWCQERSIIPGTIWDNKKIAASDLSNAEGLKLPVKVAGINDRFEYVSGATVYLSPIILSVPGEINGGIAILAPNGHESPYLPILCHTNAREISLLSFWHQSSQEYAANIDSGLITIIQSDNKHYLLFANDRLINELNIPMQYLPFIALEEIVNPLPANKYFWHIVNDYQEAKNVSIRLKCRWGEIGTQISSKPMIDPVSDMNCMIISFKSSQRAKKNEFRDQCSLINYSFADIKTNNKHFNELLLHAKAASSSGSSILLLGESGSGKDIIAQAIHLESPRSDKPFVALNCAAFSRELISSELFGYEAGSFTGAARGGTIGKFELANNGTLFLDEIGDMPLELQTSLLRVLETKSFMKVGGNKLIRVDVRIIAATNQDFREKINKKLFREDLYYRLGVVRLTVPPLRERKEDVVPLAEFFVDMICKRIGKGPFEFDTNAREFLKGYNWPGNIRELKNMIEGIINIHDGPVIELAQITGYLSNHSNGNTLNMLQQNSGLHKAASGKNLCKEDITAALMETRGNKVETAKTLGISRRTLYRRLVEFGIL